MSKPTYCFVIWQTSRQQCCRAACQISERPKNSKHRSRALDLTLLGGSSPSWGLSFTDHWSFYLPCISPFTCLSLHVYQPAMISNHADKAVASHKATMKPSLKDANRRRCGSQHRPRTLNYLLLSCRGYYRHQNQIANPVNSILANERRRYIRNVFSHWLKYWSRFQDNKLYGL